MVSTRKFDLTPDPKVLIALTRTPLRPIDALCELIDNAIDSFTVARLAGSIVQFPTVTIQLPGAAEVRDGEGKVLIRDNGPGMEPEMAEKALRAGFSGKENPYDSLGLFGMGFNISTGKLGRQTRFVTATAKSATALEAVVDLVELKKRGSFEIQAVEIPKPDNLAQGTLVEVSGWWPDGDPNAGFVRRLANLSKPRVRDEIGRIYSTLLRDDNVRISINGDLVQPFEHCVWSDQRFVERRGYGKIYAREKIDEVVGQQTRCTACNALVGVDVTACEVCGSSGFRTIKERIRGWVGVQRFDDMTDYGIDLIRNGRAIRVFEQRAFFEYVDELNERTKDYPIDSQYGRIVGEIHLDHVPVDFLKQDFQRSSPEWINAMAFLRGESSLQPTRPGADRNESPLFRIYQGYRRVRRPGTPDLYMGTNTDGSAKRIDREVEREYYERFKNREPGFYDDAEWWKRVLDADTPPTPGVVECPECGAQNLAEEETCTVCDFVLQGKSCMNGECAEQIPKSSVRCPICGTSQVPDITSPWKCEVCGEANDVEATACRQCTEARGTPSPSSEEWLRANTQPDSGLSIDGMTIELGNGAYSDPIAVEVQLSSIPLKPAWDRDRVPVVTLKSVEGLVVFVDPKHPMFAKFGARFEDVVCVEAAQYVIDTYGSQVGGTKSAANALATVAWRITSRYFADRLEEDPDALVREIATFFETIKEALPDLVRSLAPTLLNEMGEAEQRSLFNQLLAAGIDLSSLGDLKTSTSWLRHIDNRTLVRIVRQHPDAFFDGGVWDIPYKSIEGVEGVKAVAADEYKAEIRSRYANCLEDMADFERSGRANPVLTKRARSSLEFVQAKSVL